MITACSGILRHVLVQLTGFAIDFLLYPLTVQYLNQLPFGLTRGAGISACQHPVPSRSHTSS